MVSAGSGGGGTTYTLTLAIEGGGSVTLDPPNATYSTNQSRAYAAGTQVTLVANDTATWVFDHWEVDLTGESSSRTLTMSSNKMVKAVFIQPSLTVHGEGNGQVHVDPPDETPALSFTRTYAKNTSVALTATPGTGWVFKEWSIDKTGTSPTTSIVVTEQHTVKATFEKLELTVDKEGEGSVHLDPPDSTPGTLPHTEEYLLNEVVTLTATPAAGWAFKEWTGDLSSTTASDTITITGSKSVTAVFEEIELTVDKVGEGSIHLDPPDSTPGTLPHTEAYGSNEVVTLTATPASGWTFKEWTGDLTSTTATDSVTMDEAKSVTAVFEEIELTVNKQGEGSVHLDPPDTTPASLPHTEAYGTNEVVTLTAIPVTGWGFKEWTGDLTSEEETDTITMDQAKSVTAVFVQVELTVTKTGEGQVTASPPGTTQTPPFSEKYAPGTAVTLTAVPAPGWGFKEWTGDLVSTSSSDTITVDADASVTAVFEQATLTVSKSGEGQVTANPPGTTQTPTFSEKYAPGTSVTLTAIPAAGWGFKEWTGDVTGTSTSATIVVDADKSVTAVFEQATLTVSKSGEGQVMANPPGTTQTPTFSEKYTPGTSVTLTAVPASGWGFKEWTGDVTGTSTSATIVLDVDKSVTAVFEQKRLTVTKTGEGQVTTNPYGSTATPTFTRDYAPGTSVTLTAVPAAGWVFKGWSGGALGTNTSTTIVMDGDKNVHARFEQFALTVNKTGNGQVSTNPGGGTQTPSFTETYGASTTVQLTAMPAAGWGFKEWLGDAGGTNSNTSVVVNGEKSATAVFKEVFELNTAKSGQGIVEPEVGVPHIYLDGDYASLSASPAEDWSFSHWSGLSETDFPNGPEGPGTTSANPCTVTMNRDENVTANFVADCLLFEFPEPGISLELPQIVKEGANRLESLGNTAFGGFKFKLGGNYQERVTECQNIDGSRGTATKKTGEATLKFQKTDIPLYWGITKEVKSRMFGRNYKVKFTGGLRGDIGVDLIGQYEVLEYACPCLDEDECFSGRGTYNISGGVSGAVDFGTRLVAAWDTISGRAVEVEFCDINVANIAMTGRFGVENRWEGCDGQVCVSAYVDPIEFTFKVAIKGLVCKAISVRYPDDGSKLWEPLELCSEP